MKTLGIVLISIHAPLAGRDILSFAGVRRGRISIHAPLAGRDGHAARVRKLRDISIHAPLAGRDSIGLISGGRLS